IRNTDRDLVSPGLDRQTIANILAGSDGRDVTPTPVAPAIVSPTPTIPPTPGRTPTPAATTAPTTLTATPAATVTATPASTATPRAAATPRATPTRVPPRP